MLVLLELWGLTEAAQMGKTSSTGAKASVPLTLWLGEGFLARCPWKWPPPASRFSGTSGVYWAEYPVFEVNLGNAALCYISLSCESI